MTEHQCVFVVVLGQGIACMKRVAEHQGGFLNVGTQRQSDGAHLGIVIDDD